MDSYNLFEAIQYSDLEGVKEFVEENGFDFYYPSDDDTVGLTPLQNAVCIARFLDTSIVNYQEKNIPIVKYLIEKGADVNELEQILLHHDTTLMDDHYKTGGLVPSIDDQQDIMELGLSSIVYRLVVTNLHPIYLLPLLKNKDSLEKNIRNLIISKLRDYQVVQEVFGETKKERLSPITPESIQNLPYIHPSLNKDVNDLIYSYLLNK
jgi:hypothetical protein